MTGKIENSIIVSDKRVEKAGILSAKRRNVINGLDEGKRTDVTGMKGEIIFGLEKSLTVAGGLIAGLGTSAILAKKARPNTNCLPNEKRGLSPKTEKGSKGTWGPGSREDISIAILGKKKGNIGRSDASTVCWIIGLEIIATNIDNFRNLIMLSS